MWPWREPEVLPAGGKQVRKEAVSFAGPDQVFDVCGFGTLHRLFLFFAIAGSGGPPSSEQRGYILTVIEHVKKYGTSDPF